MENPGVRINKKKKIPNQATPLGDDHRSSPGSPGGPGTALANPSTPGAGAQMTKQRRQVRPPPHTCLGSCASEGSRKRVWGAGLCGTRTVLPEDQSRMGPQEATWEGLLCL